MKIIKYWINDIYYEEQILENNNSTTIFQKCSDHNIHLPCFCYHESLSIAGNCRMCLVEINTSLKLVVSCSMPLTDGVKIYTSTNRVRKAREAVIEFLLINHPLDCPICDQGGECDLQDITLAYGSDKSRYYEYTKRAVFDKECGGFVKMVMTRCIHCSRCVRFLEEVSGTRDFGMLGRGNNSEISTYVFKALNDEISANIIDLCPVGALTSKPYSFTARPWELNSLESIDIMDSMCSNVRIDYISNKIARVLPVYSKNLNEDWITNKARFFYDYIDTQRIKFPTVKVGDSFITINWYIATKIFLYQLLKFSSLNDSSIFGVSGYFSDLSSVNHMNQFFNKLGTNIYINDFLNLSSDFRSDFSLDSTIVSLENKNTFVFVCFNPRLECPLLNTRLRRILNLKGNLSIFSIGLVNQYVNLPIHNIGNKISDAINMLKGKLTANVSIFNRMQTITTNVFACSNKLMSIAVIFGISSGHVLKTKPLFINFASKHFVNYCVGVIPPYVGHVNYFELINIRDNSLYLSNNVFAYLHKVDEKLILDSICRKNNYIVYNGSHFDISVKYCNLFLPSFTHLEESQDFINLEGKRFISNKVKSLSNEVLTTQELFRLLNIINNKSMKANFHVGLISGKILSYFDFLKLDFNCLEIYNNRNTSIGSCLGIHDKPSNMVLQDNIFSSFIYNYYKTDFICRTSKNLTLASTEYLRNLNNF